MTTTTTPEAEETTAAEPETAAPSRRWLKRSLIGSAILLVVLGTAAAAAVTYDGSHRNEFLPGVRVGGLAVGGQEQGAVLRRLEARVPAASGTTVEVTAGPSSTSLTLADMGLRSDAAAVVARAREDADDMGFARRVWHRLLDKPVDRSYDVRLDVDRDAVRDAMIGLGSKVQRAPEDARIDTSSGLVSITPAADGRVLDLTAATDLVFERGRELAAAPKSDGGTVEVPLVMTKPKVTGFADVILVRTAENRLYHYENGVLVKTYVVATGTPAYPTPKGNFSIVLKRFRPTWVNPDPTGWGKSLPARIGPGPSNPLGTRAMNINAPGIRIHGTTNTRSLGTAASHGCIRMAMPEVEELFDKVDTGTPVIIITGPGKAPVAAAPSTSIGDANAPVDLEAG